ncbi:MAG: hypothetical protein CNLJKLNK_01199 [Holosporales bacterium]
MGKNQQPLTIRSHIKRFSRSRHLGAKWAKKQISNENNLLKSYLEFLELALYMTNQHFPKKNNELRSFHQTHEHD